MATIAIIGATGLVGQTLAEILADKLPNHKLLLFGNESAGQKVCYFGKTYTVLGTQRLLQCKPNYAMFMANEQVAAQFVPKLAKLGAVCVDNSTFFRLRKNVPLVVPQINGEKALNSNVIANPNCTTIQVAIALNALLPLRPARVTVATYQSASGAGKEGLRDLLEQRDYGKLKSFRHPVFDNMIAQIGEVLPNGHTTEEEKLKNESRKILNLPRLQVNAFCVRVPVSVGHGAFVNVQFRQPVLPEQAKELLQKQPDVLVLDDAEKGIFPMPTYVRHTHFVGVGRLHADGKKGLNMFVVADNLLVGAAYNAYGILEKVMKQRGDFE